MKITIDRDLCIASGTCSEELPEVFELDDEGIAIVKNPQGADDDAILEAAGNCPTEAIIIEDDDGNQIYPE